MKRDVGQDGKERRVVALSPEVWTWLYRQRKGTETDAQFLERIVRSHPRFTKDDKKEEGRAKQ